MNKKEEALKNFGVKYNCAQVVIKVFCEELGLDKELALKLSKGFGGGATRGELCGAISGGIMALGLKYGDDLKSYIEKLENKIEELYGSIRCEKILGYDISNVEDSNDPYNQQFKAKVCPMVVEDVIVIVEKELKKVKEVNLC